MPTPQEFINSADAEFHSTIDHLKREYSRLQVGRASPALVEDIPVEVYGAKQPLKGLASISIPDAHTMAIQPWDKSSLASIEKALTAANLGLNPVNEGHLIRLNMPPMTEERRLELVKRVGQLAEDAKISIRNARGTAHSAFKQLEDKDEITEDVRRLSEKHLQEKVDESNKMIEELSKKKEQEVMTI
ncbi:ribosome recycling factor [Candidatus Peregrinibacteria bacterium CG_4_9_14_0_2_um_filter_53_11]|nr:MAG: ribosome recycling factor [Candidatus Peregrinibacteria bacterium CG_4_9_14_0_2_um_filter_53_11]